MKITILTDGPILVPGPVVLQIGTNEPRIIEQDAIALCRCGASENKPLCDGAHKGCEFKAVTGELILADDESLYTMV